MSRGFWLYLLTFEVLENLCTKVATCESLGSFYLEANIFNILDVYNLFYCFGGRNPLLKYSAHLQLLLIREIKMSYEKLIIY